MQSSSRWLPTFEPSRPTWAIGPPIGYETTSAILFIITRPNSGYSFYHPTEGRRLSWLIVAVVLLLWATSLVLLIISIRRKIVITQIYCFICSLIRWFVTLIVTSRKPQVQFCEIWNRCLASVPYFSFGRARRKFVVKTTVLTRKLCYRKDDRAMRRIHGCPENFRDSLTTPTATIPNIFHGLLFGSTLWMFLQNLKSVALSVPQIIGGTPKIWTVRRYALAPFSRKFLIGLYSDWPYKCTRQICSPYLYPFPR